MGTAFYFLYLYVCVGIYGIWEYHYEKKERSQNESRCD